MKTSLAEIGRLMALPRETEGLEFKEAKKQYDFSQLYRYCVAIANEGGGRLILGVSDERPRRVVGTEAFRNSNEAQSRILDKLGFRVSVEEVAHPDGRILIFHIPARPTGTAYQLDGAYLMRCGENSTAMTEDRLRAIFDEGKPDWLSELACTALASADVVRLLDTQSYFDLMKLPYPARRCSIASNAITSSSSKQTRTPSRILAQSCSRRGSTISAISGAKRRASLSMKEPAS